MERPQNNRQYQWFSIDSPKKNYGQTHFRKNSKVMPTYSPVEDLDVLGIYHYGFPTPVETIKKVKKLNLEKISSIPEPLINIFQKTKTFVCNHPYYKKFIK